MIHFRLTIFCVLCISSLLHAQTEIGSLEEVYTLLRANHSQLKISKLQSQEWEKDYQLSRSSSLPSVSVNGITDYYINLPVQLIPAEIFGGSPGDFQEVRFGQPWVMNAGVEFQWPLIQMELWKDQQVKRYMASQGPVREQLEEERLRMEVLQQYYTVLFWKSFISYAEDLKVQVDLLRQSAEDKLSQELISQFEFNRVEVLHQQITQQVMESIARHDQSILQLKSALQINTNESLTFTDNLEDPPITLPQSTPLTARPGIQLANLENERLRSAVSAREAALWPSLFLNSRYQFQWQTDELFQGDNYIDFNFGTVGLALQWNIYSGGQKQRMIEKSKIQALRGQASYDQVLNELESRQALWMSNYQEAKNTYDINSRRYELARQNLDLAFQRLDEGISVIDEYFQIYQEYYNASQSYFQNRLNLHIYHALLQF